MPRARATKISISLPEALARRLKQAVGERGVSGFAAQAIARELQREPLGSLLAELDRTSGPLADDLLMEAREAWPTSSSSTRKR